MFTLECKEIGYKVGFQTKIQSTEVGLRSVTSSNTMERKQFEELSQWTFEWTVRIDQVVYYSLYDYSRNRQPLELDPYPTLKEKKKRESNQNQRLHPRALNQKLY